MTYNASRRRVLQTTGLGIAALTTGLTGTASAAESRNEWSQVARDAANTGYNPHAEGVESEPTVDWRFESEDAREIYPPAVADGVLVLSTSEEVKAFESDSGLELWTYDDDQFMTPVAVSEDLVFVGTRDGLRALTRMFGSEEWFFETDIGLFNPPTVRDGTVYVGHHESMLAIDAASGQLDWELPTMVSTKIAVSEQMIWSGAESLFANMLLTPDIVAGSAIDGEEMARAGGWLAYSAPANWMQIGSPTLSNERIGYMPGNGVASLDAVDYLEQVFQADPLGDDSTEIAPRWAAMQDGAVPYSPVLADDQAIFGTGTEIEDVQDAWRDTAGTVHAVASATGETDWTVETDGPINAHPAATETTIYVASDDGYLYALERSSGDQRWRQFVGEGIGSPVVAGDRVFITSDESGLLALEAAPDDPNDEDGANGDDDDTETDPETDRQNVDTDSETGEASDDGFGPGFTIPGALAAIGGLGYVFNRRDQSDRTE